jgi:MFS family permease
MSGENNDKNSLHKASKYFLVLMFVLILVDILDSYATNYINSVPSKIIGEFLSDHPEEVAQSIYQLSLGIASFGMYFVFINQALADKFGRKALLVAVTFIMSFSSLLLFFSFDITSFTIFLFITYIGFSSDMWLIYINEESPSEKRAYYTNLVVAIGVIGAVLVPVFRSIFISDQSNEWRGLTLFPIIAGLIFGIIALIFLKESSKYEEIKLKKTHDQTSFRLKDKVKDIFNSPRKKEYKMVLIMSLFNGLQYGFITLGEDYVDRNSTLSAGQINLIIYVLAIAVILGYIITGILADKIGRKPMLYFHSILQPIALIITVIGTNISSLALIVLGFALSYVAFWGLMIVLRVVASELVPTDKRGTGSGLRALFGSIGITVGLFTSSAIILTAGAGMTFIILGLPCLINIPLIYLYLKETKGVDLSSIE